MQIQRRQGGSAPRNPGSGTTTDSCVPGVSTEPGCAQFCLWRNLTLCVEPAKFCFAETNGKCKNDTLCIPYETEGACINAVECLEDDKGGCECFPEGGNCQCPKDPDRTGCLILGMAFSSPTFTRAAAAADTGVDPDIGGSDNRTTPITPTPTPRPLPVGGKVGISIAVLLLVGLAAGLWFCLSRRPPAPRNPAPSLHLAELAPPSRASLDRLAQLPVHAPPS